mgnify:CR=1 FL=1
MKQIVRNYAIIAAGSVIFSLAFDWCIVPNQVAMGGVTGLAQVIHVLVPGISIGMLVFLLNVPLFFLGWKLIGRRLLISSLFSMAVSSAAMDAIALAHTFAPMDPMLASVCGGAVMGLGLGVVFSQGATTGGTDVVARLLKLKFPWLPMGKLVLLPDFAVLVLAAAAFGRVEAALYGLVALFLSSRVMDTVLYGLDTSKVAFIISDRWEETSEALLRMDRGVTILSGTGAYTGLPKRVLLVAFKQREIVQIKRSVRQTDPNAFLIVCDAHEVLGEGFGKYYKEDL